MTTTSLNARRKTFRDSLLQLVQTNQQRLFRAASHLLSVEGKSIRPHCARLIGMATSPDGRISEAHERLAEAVELLHVGSLTHDDILDEAELRRGVPAVHVQHGAKAAVLAGDFLLSRSCALIASLGHHQLNERMAEVLGGLCEGEFQQDEQLFDLDVTLDTYLVRMALKTSGPFELACEGAAILSTDHKPLIRAARKFGFHLGRLFQMFDDLLDWSSTSIVAGKPVGQDFLAGSLTLPVIAALQDPALGPKLRTMLTPYPRQLTSELKELLFHPDAFSKALSWFDEEAMRARSCLESFPESTSLNELLAYLDRLVEQAHSLAPHSEIPTIDLTRHAV